MRAVSAEDFKLFLQENSFFATEKELACLMARFDKDRDGRVNYAEFAEEV